MKKDWDVSMYYKNFEDWQKDLTLFDSKIEDLRKYQNRLHKKGILKELLLKKEELETHLYQLYRYVSCLSDVNLKDLKTSGYMQKMHTLLSKYNQIMSFESPEIISIGSKKIAKLTSSDDFMKAYSFPFKKLLDSQKHVLSDKEEKIIANYNPVKSIFSNIYQSLSIIDSPDVNVTLKNGETVLVTQSNYRSLLENNKDQDDKRIIFEAAFKRYKDNKNTYAKVYNGILLSLKATCENRGYKSSLEAILDNNNIPVSVFMNLKDVSYENTAPLKRYINLRKKYLNISEYHTYDRFTKLADDNTKYPYESAQKMFYNSLESFSDEFINTEKEALKEGYVDVLPKDGKRTGAYSSHLYGQHPYILLNHDETLDSVFTLAHEAGHSAHSIFASKEQPMATADYAIFVAEIASTFNEHVLLDYLLKKSNSKSEKLNLLETAIDTILGTFYRQVLFATYEYEANKLLTDGEPINDETLSKIMIDLYKHYYDIDITKENGKQYVWAYIPHLFRTPYYVYQYATSYSASLKFYENIKNNVPNAMKNYLNLLKSGGSDYPVSLVLKAGVDLTTKEPFLAVVTKLNELLDQLETVLEEKQ